MERTNVQIARIRLGDINVGDIVNGHPEKESGWFQVRVVRKLPSGELVAGGASSTESVKGSRWDLLGVQITKQVNITQAPIPAPRQPADAAAPAAVAAN